MIFCNSEPFWIITFFDCIFDLQNHRHIYLSNIYNVIHIWDASIVPTDVSAWVLKIPPLQKSRHLGSSVLFFFIGTTYYTSNKKYISTNSIPVYSWYLKRAVDILLQTGVNTIDFHYLDSSNQRRVSSWDRDM